MISKDYVFQLTDKEYTKLQKWHKKVTKGITYFGAIGGELTFKITPTSIGEIVIAKCYGKKITLRKYVLCLSDFCCEKGVFIYEKRLNGGQ